MEIIYGWQKPYQERSEELEKANSRIVVIAVEKNNLLEEHFRSLQESVAAVK